jgi:hypothetical protein
MAISLAALVALTPVFFVLAAIIKATSKRVELVRRRGPLWRRVQADGSYGSAGDPRVLFGLGSDEGGQTIRVHWIGGAVEQFHNLFVDRYWVLEAGRTPRTLE